VSYAGFLSLSCPLLEATTKLRNLVLKSHQMIDSTFASQLLDLTLSSGADELITFDG
jgi:hypothetical protein